MMRPLPLFMPLKAPIVRRRLRSSLFLLSSLLAFSLGFVRSTVAQTVEQVLPEARQGYVTDLAHILSEDARENITALCAELTAKTQVQIAVVTIKSLGGQPIEQYSVDLAERLGIGPKSSNEGVLILLSLDDRKNRIETGYGLEPILPDGKTGGFQREAVPLLRAGNYDGAMLLMTRRVADVIAADKGVTLSGLPSRSHDESTGNPHIPPFVVLFIVFVIFSIIRAIIQAARGGGPRRPGGFGGGSGWWIWPLIFSNMGGDRRGGWGGGGFGGGGGGGGFGGFGGGGFGGGGSTGSW